MKTVKKLLTLILALSLSLSLLAGCGAAPKTSEGDTAGSAAESAEPAKEEPATNVETIVWKMGLTNQESHPSCLAAKEMAESIYEKTNGRYKIEVYGGSQLGSETELAEGVRMGTVQFCFTATTTLASFVPELLALDMPMIISDYEHADKALYSDDSEAAKYFVDAIDNSGFKCVALCEQGFRNVMSNKPVTSLEDLKNLKIRTMENPLHLELWKTLGASPIALASAEVLPGMQQKTIDACEMANTHFIASGIAEVCTYYTMTHHLYTVGAYSMNKECWESLSAEDQAIFSEAFKACQAREIELQRGLENTNYEKILGIVKESYEIPVEDMEPLMQKLYDNHPEYNEIIDLIKSYR